jgi:alpha-ketoglutarate-dependent taurine dioxygenase
VPQTTTDARAWQRATIDDHPGWFRPLSARLRHALEETVSDLRRAPRPVTELHLSGSPCRACGDDLQSARDDLERGRGFVVLRGFPSGAFTTSERQAMYWLVGQLLGVPAAQNVQGTLLYDVKDTNQDVRYGARFSVTNAESSFHTDNSFGEEVVDYVGLLCLNKARSGGLSQVVSGYRVHQRLAAEHPDVLPVLGRPFHFDRRGGLRPGDAPTITFPILEWRDGGLVIRYLRYWIETGHEKAGVPLTAEQQHALDVLDGVLADPELRAEFHLEPGDMFFINNRWIFHNRTAFEDDPEPERRRHLVRLWLRAGARP